MVVSYSPPGPLAAPSPKPSVLRAAGITPRSRHFADVRGNVRLAVVDGLVTTDVALLLAGWLQGGEQLVVYGTAIDPAAEVELSAAYRGSHVRQVPQSILDDYRQQWRNDATEWLTLAGAESSPDGPISSTMTAGAE